MCFARLETIDKQTSKMCLILAICMLSGFDIDSLSRCDMCRFGFMVHSPLSRHVSMDLWIYRIRHSIHIPHICIPAGGQQSFVVVDFLFLYFSLDVGHSFNFRLFAPQNQWQN